MDKCCHGFSLPASACGCQWHICAALKAYESPGVLVMARATLVVQLAVKCFTSCPLLSALPIGLHERNAQCGFGKRGHDLTSRRKGRDAQYAVYDLNCLEEQVLGPPRVELEWCDILQKSVCELRPIMILRSWVTATNGKVNARSPRCSFLLEMV